MSHQPRLEVVFFRTDTGNEPVRQWLRNLETEDKKTIGGDIQMVQYRWPVGPPLVGKIRGFQDLREVRSQLKGRRIARVLFTVQDNTMALLHSFMKKTARTPHHILVEANRRKNLWQQGRE